ncbi:MAG TPA: glycosyltransferase [Candidatus Angelobacter sp.]|nr:glycosyltransferase [Candidatus Angelobacter sp.]
MLKVNVCVEGSDDWLFGDLRKGFQHSRVLGVETIATEAPIPDADAWIFIRTDEAAGSPDFSRTVVCIHDLYDHDGMYGPGQMRRKAMQASGIVLCHPQQRQILQNAGIDLSKTMLLERPLGALRQFTVKDRPCSNHFRIGWVGREHPRKRSQWFAEALGHLAVEDAVAVLIGKDLASLCRHLSSRGIPTEHCDRAQLSISDYPRLYQQLDCLVITSSTEAGPLPLFEALATGVPVVSTPVGWSPLLAAKAPEFVLLAESPREIADRLRTVRLRRAELYASRREIAAIVENYRLDDWFEEVLRLSAALANRNDGHGKPADASRNHVPESTCRAE